MRHLSDDDLDIIGIYLSERILGRLDRIDRTLDRLAQHQGEMLMDLTQLTADVSANTDVTASAATLLASLATELRNAAGDPAAVNALAASLEANNAALAAAVAQNTPAGSGPPVAAAFVARLAGETYADYTARVAAWNADPANAGAQNVAADEATWGTFPVGG